MSFILDALQKSERERNAGHAPALDEALTRPLPAAARRSRRDAETRLMVKTGLGVTAAFLLAGIAWWALSRPAAPERSDAVVAQAAPAPVPAAAPPVEQPLTEPPPATAMRIDPERLRAPVAGPELGPEAASLDELLDEAPEAATAPDELPAPAVDAPATPAPAEPPPPPPAERAAVRPLKDMPPSFRSEFPALAIQVHVYDANPLRRFVLVNGKKYRETDTLVEGPRVVEIVPEGVVVEQRGSRVLIENPR